MTYGGSFSLDEWVGVELHWFLQKGENDRAGQTVYTNTLQQEK